VTTNSRVPAIIRIAQALGVLQAVVMITATIWLIADTLRPQVGADASGEQPLRFGDIGVLAAGLLLAGGLILATSLLLSRRKVGPRVALMTLEVIVLVGVIAFIGIAALITAPLALLIIVCLVLSSRAPSVDRVEPPPSWSATGT
jgi:hypothetical protein